MSEEVTPQQLQNMLAMLRENGRLSSLSNRQLVEEVLNTNHADSPLVVEMMNRLDPDWAKPLRLTEVHP